MTKFILKDIVGDTVGMVEAYDVSEAEEFFSKMKVLSVSDLLRIFTVEKVID